MKRLYSIILSLIMLSQMSGAQDLLYFIKGEADGAPVALDSILVENLSNQTRILFGNLPARKDYIINLTQGIFQGTTGISPLLQEKGLTLLQNQPGVLVLAGNQPYEEVLHVSVFNTQGECLFADPSFRMGPFNQLTLGIGIPGVYIAKVSSERETRSFKVLGQSGTGNIRLSAFPLQHGERFLKSGSLSSSSDFRFQPGDSIRVSVYRHSWYAYPENFRISSSDTLRFRLSANRALISGISNAFVDLRGVANVIFYQPITGKTILKGTIPPLKQGDVIIVESGNTGYLRKVVSSGLTGDSLIVHTRQAYLNDVFVDKAFRFSSRLMAPLFPVSISSSPLEMTRAMTDPDGWSHPAEMVLHTDGNQIIRIAPVFASGISDTLIPGLNFTFSLDKTDILGSGGEDIHFFAEEGDATLAMELAMEFDFKRNGTIDQEIKADKGSLETFRYAITSHTDFKALFGVKLNKRIDKEVVEEKITGTQRLSLKYYVEGIPVWVDVNLDLYRDFRLSSVDSFSGSWGYDQKITALTGGIYNGITNDFTPFSECGNAGQPVPLKSTGASDATARFSLYPGILVNIFGIPGMYNQIKPWGEAIYKARVQEVTSSAGKANVVCWNSSLRTGIDLATEGNLSFAGLPEADFKPGIRNCSDQEIWKSPFSLTLQSALPSSSKPGSVISLRFLVTDLTGNDVPGCPVLIQGEGTFSRQTVYTGQSGTVDVEWTLPHLRGYHTFSAVIFNTMKEVISAVNDSVEVYDPEAYGTMTHDGRTYKTKKIGQYTWMTENLAYLPAVISPSEGSTTLPYYYVPGYYGSDTREARSTPGYALWGVMYNWNAAMNGENPSPGATIRGICPPGWHLPGDKEWVDLLLVLISQGYGVGGSGNRVAKAMASKNNWRSSGVSGTPGNIPGSNNSSEFAGLPGGFRCNDAGNFTSEGSFATWWSSQQAENENSYHYGFFYNTSVVIKYYSTRARGYFVRCVKD